ncbi:AMP-binding protein [Gordonia shandongensis]|uniref:AMP-binding protein n=1 Tax=Gordonia shandongensis TaxID=376351 RepID=UPI00047B6408|nr:AMP-binding protein [Gordonia shandongensis]
MSTTELARKFGDKPAVVSTVAGQGVTYRELEERSNAIAHLFRREGLGRGDHVAMILGNRPDSFPAIIAAMRTGLYCTLVNRNLSPDEAAYIVDDCGARLLVHEAEFTELAERSAATAPALRSRYVLDGEPGTAGSLCDAVRGGPTTPVADETQGATMLYSSGTTGRPKGVLPRLPDAPYGTMTAWARWFADDKGITEDTVLVSPGPIYHSASLAWAKSVLGHGGTHIVAPKFDAEQLLAAIERYGVTHLNAVPTMFVRMLRLPESVRARYDLSSLRAVFHGGAACPIPVKRAMIDWLGPIITEYYGGTEGVVDSSITTEEWLRKPGSVGRPATAVVRISDDGVTELPVGATGTIWFESSSRDFEYHNDDAKTREAHSPRGWTTMGDIGHVDEDGYLFIADRRSDLIVSGGVNIYPQEVEDVLMEHPDVVDVAVVGLSDEEWGQMVHAVVKPADGVEPGPDLEARIIAFVRSRIAHFKAPRSVEFRSDLPRLESGKLQRWRLRDEAER